MSSNDSNAPRDNEVDDRQRRANRTGIGITIAILAVMLITALSRILGW